MNKLAIDGGPPHCVEPEKSWPYYAQDEIDAVSDLMKSGKVNQWTGTSVRAFEEACEQALGLPHAIALANGTLALDLALRVAGVGPGDEVIVTPRSFLASVSCIVTCGATPVFADVDPDSQNLTAKGIEAVISERTKAIIPVHLNGWPCDMEAIMAVAKQHELYVIEDCAQAHGAEINGKPIGSFGHAAAFSFCQDKIISTGGEGGMVMFASQKDWQSAWSFKDHGKDYDTVFHKQHPPGFRWLHNSFGTNWRLSGIQAAIGLKQLEKLDDWRERRTMIADKLSDILARFPGIYVPQPPAGVVHAHYRFSFQVEKNGLSKGWNREKLMAAINAEGVSCLEVCPEIYREKAFDNLEYPTPDCPEAIELGQRALLIKIYPTLTDLEVENMCEALEKVLNVATK